jgi:DNA polymerase-3 subunit gamma/tau
MGATRGAPITVPPAPGGTFPFPPAPEGPGEDFEAPARRAAQPEELKEQWPAFLRRLHGKDPVLAAKLSRSRASLAPDGAMLLEVIELYTEAIEKPETLAVLQRELQDYFGVVFPIHVAARSTSPAASAPHDNPSQSGAPKSNLKRLVMEHPLVQAAIEILGGELIDIRTPRNASHGED